MIRTIDSRICGLDLITLIYSNEEKNDIMENSEIPCWSSCFVWGDSETIKDKTREQRVGFIGVLLDTLVVRLLGNILELKVELKLGKKKRKLVNIFNSAKPLTNFEYLKFTKVSLILTTFSQKII